MRLWHIDLLPVLPKKQLVSQWRECVAIKRQWEKGTLKHPLVSYVMDYDKGYFLGYVIDLLKVFRIRGIKYDASLLDEIVWFCMHGEVACMNINYPEHNDRYLTQCYYNLEEKYDRGMIGEEEWIEITKSEEIQRIR